MASNVEDYLLVAAIDFGTTYSGFAYSMRHEFKRDPTQVNARTWTASSFQSHKTSTCILFKKDRTFHSFGFEAEDKYTDLAEENAHHGWYFFRRFKMQLYDAQNLHEDFPLESDNGSTLPAMKVFSESLRYLKDELLKDCKKHGTSLDVTDMKFVLTVPAIWTDPAKSFMRASAVKAGIPGDRLTVALEPEAAAMFVRHLPLKMKREGTIGDSFTTFAPGQKYLVLDAGGGTVDITTHQIKYDQTVREILSASGGNWGGTQVDESFKEFLEDIFGNDVIEELKKVGKSDFLEIFRDFEMKKRSIRLQMDSKINIKIPTVLKELFESFHPGETIAEKVATHRYGSNVIVMKDKFRIDPVIACSFFDRAVHKIVSHLNEIPTLQHVDTILMVGGFSESPLLVERVKSEVKGKNLIVPLDAGLVVLKGAVLFGHDPSLIAERISKYTYGANVSRPFDSKIHLEEKKYVENDGSLWCRHLFAKHVEINQSIIVGETQTVQHYHLRYPHKNGKYKYGIFATAKQNPIYVTDKGCNKIGSLTVEIPFEQIRPDRDSIALHFLFGGTEIEVKAIFSRTGEEFKTYVSLPS